MNEIRWRPSTVHEHGEDALVGKLVIGAVFRLKHRSNWYGYVRDDRIGSCSSLDMAKYAVEMTWHTNPYYRELLNAVD